MPQLRTTNNFERMPDATLIAKAGHIYTQISSQPEVFPNPTPALPTLHNSIAEYQQATLDALNGDRLLIVKRKGCKEELVNLLYTLSHYVLMTAAGDPAIAAASGYSLNKQRTPAKLTKPEVPQLALGKQSGNINMRTKAVAGARAYKHQYSTDSNIAEESWQTRNCTTVSCLLTGLIPGTVYYFRIGVIGPRNQVLYSDASTRMVA